MKEFKNQLKRELQQDAPYTNELKQRLLQTKRKPKKRNWQVLSVSVAMCCLIGMILLAQFSPSKSVQTANEGTPLLPIIDVVNELEVIEPQKAYLEIEAFTTLKQHIFALPVHYREVIILFYYEEFEVSEIADLLMVSQNTVRTRIRRARELLKNDQELEALFYEGI